MSYVGRIEFDVAANDFRAVYLTGAAEWSLDAEKAFHGTRAECAALAAQQPLRCLIVGNNEPRKPTPADVFEAMEKRRLA